MPDFKLLINGKMVEGADTLDVINPATEELAGTCSRASEAQLNDAVAVTCSVATIHNQRLTGHIGCVIGGQE